LSLSDQLVVMIDSLPTDFSSVFSAQGDRAFLVQAAWTDIPSKAKLVLTTPIEVLHLTSNLPVWHPAEIRVSASNPSTLTWTDASSPPESLDFVQFYLSRECNDSYGIKVGATPLLADTAGLPQGVSWEQIVTFRSEGLELAIALPTSMYGDWKKALSSYLKSYLRVSEREESHAKSPSDFPLPQSRNSYDRNSLAKPDLGPIFDISWTWDQLSTCVKLTCIDQSMATHVEYFNYEREGRAGGKSKGEIREIVANGLLNAANLMIFEHCLDEIGMMGIWGSGTKAQNPEYFSCMNSNICSFLAYGANFEWVLCT